MVFPALGIVNAIEFGTFCRKNHSITGCTIFLGLIRPRSVSGPGKFVFCQNGWQAKKKLKTYFLNMDLETMMTSSWASGFPQFMTEILEHMDFEDLLKTRLLSTTFHKFLMNSNQRDVWIQAASKVFSKFFQSAYDIEKLPATSSVFKQNWFIEELKNRFQQEWIEVLEKIKETATIPQIIKICHLLKYFQDYNELTHLMALF